MNREGFLSLLVRAVKDSLITEGEASDLLRRFDAGELEINEDVTPLEPSEAIQPVTDEDVDAAITALLALGTLAYLHLRREHFREVLQNRFIEQARGIAKARAAGEIALPVWQRQMSDAVRVNIIQQVAVGSGRIPDASALTEAVSVQAAYVSRWADEQAVKALLAEPASELGMMARAALYAGAGRAEGYKAEAELYEPGTVVQYVATDDSGTCQPCLDAEGAYRIDEPFPVPGDVCDGFGHCRCRLEYAEGVAA